MSDPRPRTRIKATRGWGLPDLREVWRFRDLLRILTGREIKLRYKQAALGVLWVILQPLASSLLLTLVFGYFVHVPSEGRPYLLFVFAGMLPWALISAAVQRASNSIVFDARLISKIYFPRLLLPLAGVLSSLTDFSVALLTMLVVMACHGVWPSQNALALPALVALALTCAAGLGILFAALNVFYRDFMYAMPLLLQLWMYSIPIVFPVSLIPERWSRVYCMVNPGVGIVEGFRWALLGDRPFPTEPVVASAITSVALLVIGGAVFRRVERHFADAV